MVKVSIITASFQAAGTIRDSLNSVRDQGLPLQHIIIDGGSTDGTVEIINEFGSSIDVVISEPDSGIYDAMNKGFNFATGDVIGLLNADDYYHSKNVLKKVVSAFEDSQVEACYGDLVYVENTDPDKVVRYWHSGPFKSQKFYWGWMPPHPTFFVRRNIYEKYGLFRLDLGSAADYELMLRFLVRHKISVKYIPEVIVRMRTGGVSNASISNRLKANRKDKLAWKVNGIKPYPWTLLLKPLLKVPQYFTRNFKIH